MKMTITRLLPVLLPVAFSGTATAAAFQLWEQNASGLGTAYAGSAAVADNAATIFFNPAGMTQLEGIQTSVGVAAVGPSFEFENKNSRGTGVLAGLNGGNGGDAGSWAAVPNAYLAWRLAPQWSLGLGLSTPFGLATKYDDPNWIGRYHTLEAELRTVNVNPSVAYKLNDKLSLGFGLNYQRLDAKMTNIVGLSTPSELKGDDGAWGWNAGALYSPSPAMRVGVSYRSAIEYKIDGTQTVGTTAIPVHAKLTMPDTFILSVWQQVSDRWEAMGDLSYTHWKTLDRLNVISNSNGVVLGTEAFDYSNAWRFAWGAAYKIDDAWKVKFGIAYDHTPTTDDERSPRVPDNDRLWLSLGGQWKPAKNSAIDIGYAYLHLRDPNVDTTKTITNAKGAVIGTSTLSGKYKDSCHVLGIQYSQGF